MEKKKKKPPVDDFAWQEYSRDEFKETFPHLHRELEGEGVPVSGYRASGEKAEKELDETCDFSGYSPTVVDFLRRCETDEEALEIINWMEDHGEITHDIAKELRITLVRKGVRAFGPKKEWGWYEKHRRE
ncbi:DUF2095 family protein [Thermococcus sp.]|uniref:DUF2095 family protein n=1 Tax=Thermococcus sp. TaxID=35749 RepID=UPI002617F580|nr:DUF2095 family protein [Thermococcus sp.]